MKIVINRNRGIFIVVFTLLVSQIAQAQGTVYVSNLGETPTANNAIGSDAWVGAGFFTGTNAGGYLFDSVQLLLGAASGNPSSFSVSIYTGPHGLGSAIGNLNGPSDPAAAGVYTYSAASSISLSPHSEYFIIVTAGTDVANGAYEWNQCAASFNSSDGWFLLNGSWFSSDGVLWSTGGSGSVDSQFAIYATAIPEPATLALAGLGLAALSFWRRRQSSGCASEGSLQRNRSSACPCAFEFKERVHRRIAVDSFDGFAQ